MSTEALPEETMKNSATARTGRATQTQIARNKA
jgi:hypothetical protein